jgi:DNA-binding SARP family transcriptional activator
MPQLRLFLFGIPRLEYAGKVIDIRRRKALALAAYLALANKAVSREFLAELLWADTDIEQARASLRTTLHLLTSCTDREWLLVDKHQVSVNHALIEVDCGLFGQNIAQARQHKHPNGVLCESCFQSLHKAETLYHAGFLADFTPLGSSEFEDWQRLQSIIFQREYSGILRRIAQYYHEQCQNTQEAITYGLRWLALDPLHEPAHRLLMRLYHESGQRTDALRQYQDCVSTLDRELATPPEDETVLLYEQIRDGKVVDQKVSQNSATSYSLLPPLPSLVVGREAAIQDIKARLGIRGQRRANVVIQGLPGVGKSTIVAYLAHDTELGAAFPDGVLWASLGEKPDVLSKLQSWANALALEENKNATIETLSAQISAKLQDKRILLIVDDVWQVEHSKSFRVGGTETSILFTSRLNDVATALTSSQLDFYNLSVLTYESSVKLLEMLIPNTVQQFPQETMQLVQDLEGLPIALQVAGRLLQAEERLGWGVIDLLAELREGARLLEAHAPSDMMQQDTTPTVAALLKRSTDTLNEVTQERFALLGLFVPKPATFDLGAMCAIWDVADAKPTARELVNRGLLEPVGGGRFQMHALLVLHARSMLGG